MGCPIDLVCNKGAGSALLQKPGKMAEVVRSAAQTLSCPLTVKLRKARHSNGNSRFACSSSTRLQRRRAWRDYAEEMSE